MCSFASNAIGSHAAPLRATLLHFFSKNIFRTLFFCTRSQKATFKGFPTKWYTLSLYESVAEGDVLGLMDVLGVVAANAVIFN